MAFTATDLPSLAGRSALVTGANSGIGLWTAMELARHGADVVLACRNPDSGKRAADKIRAAVPGANLEVAALDLASLDSIRSFAEIWTKPLHLLINNAGVMAPPTWRPTADGYELQFGTNHLGHFALTGRLLPTLLAVDNARVVTVSSLAHRAGDAGLLFGNPKQGYQPMKAYSNSKLANLLFGLELQRRAEQHGATLTSTVAHPGVSATNLFTNRDGMGANRLLRAGATAAGRVVLQSARAGADPSLFAATLAQPGSYSGPRWFGEFRGPAVTARTSPSAQDVGLSAQLWDLSEQLTDVTYDWSSAALTG